VPASVTRRSQDWTGHRLGGIKPGGPVNPQKRHYAFASLFSRTGSTRWPRFFGLVEVASRSAIWPAHWVLSSQLGVGSPRSAPQAFGRRVAPDGLWPVIVVAVDRTLGAKFPRRLRLPILPDHSALHVVLRLAPCLARRSNFERRKLEDVNHALSLNR